MFCKSAGLLFVSCMIMISSAYAQANNPYVAAADKYFANGDFYSASQYYEKFLKGGKTRSNDGFNPYASTASNKPKKVVVVSDTKDKVLYNLAESYRELHYHDKAAPRYQEVIASNKQAFPLARFHYAETLRAKGRFDEATAEFTTFKQEYQTADKYSEMASRELANLEFIKQQLEKKTSSFTVAKSKGLNAEGGTYAPTWMNDKTLVFTSTRPQSGDKSNHNRLYVANYSDTGASVSLLPVPQPNDSEQGVASVAPDGNSIYLTRWDVSKNKKTSNIFVSKKDKGNWSDPTPVAALNASGSNSQQPCVMPGGKQIIFSSDRSGGSGGFDLWSADIDANGNVGAPVNLGATINTAHDEQAPAFHAASNTLVFSSNGRKGMGGFDFFYTKSDGSSYSEPKNFGHPVNSAKDDIYFTSRGPANNILEDVTFSSDRDAACCLELFSLKRPKTAKQISGLVVACLDSKPLSNIKVVIMDTIQNKIVSELRTDTAGRFSFTADQFQPLKASASDSGYFNNSIVFTGPEDQEESFYTAPELCLTAIPLTSEDAITLDNVYYDFNSAALQKRSFTSLNKLVTLLKENPALKIELNAHTDSKGDEDFNQRLSDKRAQSVVNYLVSKGIPKSRLEAKGLGESAPVAENTNPDGTDNPEGRQENRRTEFKVLEK